MTACGDDDDAAETLLDRIHVLIPSPRRRVGELLDELEDREVDDPGFGPLVEQLIIEVTQHITPFREARLFAALLELCSAQHLESLGDRVREARRASAA